MFAIFSQTARPACPCTRCWYECKCIFSYESMSLKFYAYLCHVEQYGAGSRFLPSSGGYCSSLMALLVPYIHCLIASNVESLPWLVKKILYPVVMAYPVSLNSLRIRHKSLCTTHTHNVFVYYVTITEHKNYITQYTNIGVMTKSLFITARSLHH